MSPLPPMTVAKWGVYGAALFALLSAWLGLRAGGTWDYVILRTVFVFVLLAIFALGLEAALTLLPPRPQEPQRPTKTEERGTPEGGEPR